MSDPIGIGIVGAGVISSQYVQYLRRMEGVSIVAVTDRDPARADDLVSGLTADERPASALDIDSLMASAEVGIVLNLTVPRAHAEVALRAVEAGKHVFNEKPLATDADSGRRVLAAAERAGVRVGAAPDTVLGTGIQSVRAALDAGEIGEPVAATAFWGAPGHELWHPNPDFYYQAGGGPLLDMGPYYLTSLVTLLGPVLEVVGMSARSRRRRVIDTGERAGAPVSVDPEVPTHATALLRHRSGVVSTVVMSFEVWKSSAPRLEVFGTAGALSAPDPNMFDGVASIATPANREWTELGVRAGYVNAGRGVGLVELAASIRDGRPHRASGALAQHVLEISEAVTASQRSGRVIGIATQVERPEPVTGLHVSA